MRDTLIRIEADKIEKKFGKTLLFKNINFTLKKGDSFFITGQNGSGKSTLLQILAGIQKPSAGNIVYASENSFINSDCYKNHFSFTGPQVNPYDMMTAIENLRFTAAGSADESLMIEYLDKFDLT